MRDEVKEIGIYMAAFAEELLYRALTQIYKFIKPSNAFDPTYPNIFSLGIAALSVAHGTEILLKSVLANEHPLLLLDSKAYQRTPPIEDQIDLDHLFNSQTIKLSDLPYAIWAATGYKINDSKSFNEFIKLRNKIQHLGIPHQEEILNKTLSFLFTIVDPILNLFWNNDLLNLIRPYGVEDFVTQLEKRNVSYTLPKWYDNFDNTDEQNELEKLYKMAERQSEIAEQLNHSVTEWFVQMSLIIPVDKIEFARREVIRITGHPAEKETFSVQLSPNGRGSATHLGAHTAANLDIAVRHVKLLKRCYGDYAFTVIQSGTPEEKRLTTFDAHCERLGLERILFEAE
jgi:uncharacterized protein YfkK (UPF0435 family)